MKKLPTTLLLLLSCHLRGKLAVGSEITHGPRSTGDATLTAGPHGVNDVLYPLDGLLEPADLYSLGNKLPTSRVLFALAVGPEETDEFVILHGGKDTDGKYLDDVNLYDTRSQRWSGVILRMAGYDDSGKPVNLMAGDEFNPTRTPEFHPTTRTYFAGDLPLARAEHRTVFAGSKGLMYMFGGDTVSGLSSEFYTFNPKELKWRRVQYYQFSPERRAGHSMIAYQGDIYLFGGRGVIQTHDETASNYKEIYALNDVWKFNEESLKWTVVDNKGLLEGTDDIPVGRQDAAMAIVSGHLFIYGGRHPNYNLIFPDMWCLEIGNGVWRVLKTFKTHNTNNFPYAPPAMYKANAISIDKDCANSQTTEHEDEFYGIRNNPNIPDTVDSECGLLIYGGVYANDLQTSIGQVYRVNLDMKPSKMAVPINATTGEKIDDSSSLPPYLRLVSVKWEYARLTSGEQPISRGRLRKNFAYEEIVYSKSRNLMYEFGGLEAVRESLVKKGRSEVQGSFSPQSLETPGGRINEKYYDLETGEHLRASVELITTGPWNYTTAFTQSQPQLNFTEVKFLREFRTYRMNYKDLVQVTVQDEFNSS